MRLYALLELGDPETIQLLLTPEEAQQAFEGCLREVVSSFQRSDEVSDPELA